jgi:hypothetical protein
MKIVSWNLRNIGQTKLTNTFGQTFNAFGLGNNVVDYVAGLVMGTNRWNAVPNLSTNPADVFVVIELKSGGNQKGKAISGTCIPTLNDIKAKLNTMVGVRYPANPNPPYIYDYVIPQVVGYHETVGILFNTQRLQLTSAQAFRNNSNQNWINPRTPYGAMFTIKNSNPVQTLQVVGIHAPPPSNKGGNAVKYRPPIDYSNVLRYINPVSLTNTFIMGDFNCNPNSRYTNGNNVQVAPFQGLLGANFRTFVPNGTLSSVRTKPANANPVPSNYLSDAFDNIIFYVPSFTAQNTNELVVDMIGQARDMSQQNTPNISTTNLVALVNAYNVVSDHMPVVIEW